MKNKYLNKGNITKVLWYCVPVFLVMYIIFRIMISKNECVEPIVLPVGSTNINQSQAKHYASLLYQAMGGYGTDEDMIIDVFKNVQSESDFNAIFNEFGVREYGTFGIPLYSFLPSEKLNLLGWLRAECSDDLYNEVTKHCSI